MPQAEDSTVQVKDLDNTLKKVIGGRNKKKLKLAMRYLKKKNGKRIL